MQNPQPVEHWQGDGSPAFDVSTAGSQNDDEGANAVQSVRVERSEGSFIRDYELRSEATPADWLARMNPGMAVGRNRCSVFGVVNHSRSGPRLSNQELFLKRLLAFEKVPTTVERLLRKLRAIDRVATFLVSRADGMRMSGWRPASPASQSP